MLIPLFEKNPFSEKHLMLQNMNKTYDCNNNIYNYIIQLIIYTYIYCCSEKHNVSKYFNTYGVSVK